MSETLSLLEILDRHSTKAASLFGPVVASDENGQEDFGPNLEVIGADELRDAPVIGADEIRESPVIGSDEFGGTPVIGSDENLGNAIVIGADDRS